VAGKCVAYVTGHVTLFTSDVDWRTVSQTETAQSLSAAVRLMDVVAYLAGVKPSAAEDARRSQAQLRLVTELSIIERVTYVLT